MTKQVINVGTTANDRHGDSLRTAFIKVNQNFAEIYAITNIAELTELSQDYAAALFTNGHHIGITVHYDDVHNTIDLTVLGMISTGVTPPIDPILGTLWYDTSSGRTYIYYNNTWVDASPENLYTLPNASNSILGGIKVGTNLSIDVSGVLSAVGQINSDWTAVSGLAQILNKPTIPDAQVNSDWTSASGVSEILNKPTIPDAQVNSDWTSASGVSEILNKPTIPDAQVNSDWDAVSGVAEILNKPTIPTSFDRLISPDTTKEFVLTDNGTVTMPFGSLFTETSTTLILTPPGAFPGQGLVISPTTGTGLTSDVAFAAGATITVRLTDAGSHTHEDLTGSGGRDGSWPYTITGATAYQLGLAGLSGTFHAIDWVLFGGNYVNDIIINVPIGTTATGFVVTLDDQVGPPYTGFPVPTTITTTVGSIVTPSESSHIHILSGDQTNVDLFLGNDNQYVKIGKNNGDVVIGTNGNTHNWIFSADSTTTVPSGLYLPTGNLTETVASVEVIIDDLVLDMVVDYSTGEGDNIPADTYGTHIQINHPWTIYQFTTDPAPPLAVEDIIAGEGVPAFSQVLVIGTGIHTKIAVTDKTLPLLGQPAHNAVITITRPITLATLSLNTVADTNISLLPTGLGNVLFESDLIPITSGAHSLGTPTRRFKQLWLSGGSIYLQDETTGADLRVTAIDGDFVIAGGAGLRVGEFRFHDNQLFINNPDRDIIIGTIAATADVVFNRPIRVNTPFGIDSFSVQRDGHVEFHPPQIPAGDIGALAIIGTADSSYQPVINAGGMLHITAYDGDPARITMDTFGIGNVPIFVGRKARGIAATPTPTQTGDILARFAGLGYAIPNYYPTGATLPTSIEFTATDNYSNTLFGSKATIYTYKQGTTTRTESLNIDSTNITLPVNSGITFGDTTRQTTAGITSVSIGDGLTGSVVDGALTIDATGVQSVTAAVGDGEIAITSDLSGRNLTLTLPQPLGITSTPEFLSLTLQDLTVNGTYTVAINTTVAGKILYLASDSTLATQIDGGGVVLGTGAFARSITYDLTPDRWDTDGAGLKTENLEAIDGLFTGVLQSQGHAMFGTGYIGTDYPNTTIQSDTNVNDFGYVVNINHNGGTNASSDFRAVNDIGTASTNFIDMGINSSTFANPAQSITGTNDGYLFVNGGDLCIGTESAGANILMHTGGNTIDKLRGTWSDTGLNVVGSVTAAGFYGPLTGNVTGNADTVTNGVYTNGSYANPSWITSLAYSKLTGTPTIPTSVYIGTTSVAFNRASGALSLAGTSIDGNAGTVTNGVYSNGSYANPSWITSLAYSKLTDPPAIPASVYIGTTSVAFNRASGALSLAGTSIDGNAGTVTSISGNSLTSLQIVTGLGFTPGTGTVTSVAAITLGTTGTDLTSTIANGTTTPVITLNVPTASALNRGVLSAADWSTFNGKGTVTSITSSTVTIGGTSAIPTVNLTSGIVTAGTTGSATLIPVITVDTYGRITGVSTAANPQGTVTSVSGTGTVSGLTLTGSFSTSGSLTLGGTLSVTPSGFGSVAANAVLVGPNGTTGNPTFRILASADIPNNAANTSGSAGSTTASVTFNTSGGAVAGTSFNGSTARTIDYSTVGAYAASNPSGYTSNQGTVTSVAAITLGTTGTDLTSTIANGTTTPVITLNVPTASALNRGVLSAADWTTFNGKGVGTVTSVSGTGTVSGLTLTGSFSTSGSLTLGGTLSAVTSAVAGTGISVSSSTGAVTFTNTDLGSSQNIYKTIAVSGQTSVTAASNTATLTLVAGTGITLTTDNTAKSVTITGSVGVSSLAGGTNIILSGSTGAVTIQRVDGCQTVVTANSGATYNVTLTDQYVGTTRSATGTGTITLPLGSTVPVGRQYIIKDEGGSSGSFLRRITVATSGGNTIDGSSTRGITSNYGSLTVLWTGTIWSVI